MIGSCGSKVIVLHSLKLKYLLCQHLFVMIMHTFDSKFMFDNCRGPWWYLNIFIHVSCSQITSLLKLIFNIGNHLREGLLFSALASSLWYLPSYHPSSSSWSFSVWLGEDWAVIKQCLFWTPVAFSVDYLFIMLFKDIWQLHRFSYLSL